MTDVHPLDDPLTQPSVPPEPKSRRARGHVQSFTAGRICADEACNTALSRYNDATRCWVHSVDKSTARRP